MGIRAKLTGGIGAAAVAAALALAPFGAQAATEGAFAFTGVAGNITPGVQLVGGSGSYTFGGGCDGWVAINPTGAGVACSINSSGTFTNTVCGTGNATGSATITFTPRVGTGSTISGNYSIRFVSTIGLLTGSSSEGATLLGIVQITPKTGNCVTPVTAFQVSGLVAAV